jgi:hypothetical protein
VERSTAEARAGTSRGAVTVLVSRRFGTVRSAGLILGVDGGGVTGLGARDNRIPRDGLYSEPYPMQARAHGQTITPAHEAA